MTMLQKAASVWVALVVAIVLLNIFVAQPFGPAALGAILEPYLVLTALVAGAFCFRSSRWQGRVLVLSLILLVLPRYVPAWTSFAAEPGQDHEQLRVSTWNILAGDDAVARALQGISASDADLIGLQELAPEVAAALSSDATGIAFQAMAVEPAVSDVGLLSRYPIVESEAIGDLPALRVVVSLPSTEQLVVYVAHPPLARFVRFGDVPVGVEFSVRDVAVAMLRQRIDEDLADDRSVVVMGDLNTTEREPAYGWLSAGLRDAHLDAGVGPGFTWRPSPLAFVPVGMLRIDYILSTPDLVASSATVDCTMSSDHCRLDVALTVTRSVGIP